MNRPLFPILLLAVLAASPAAGLDEELYAALLERHTRPVEDLARTRVDYAALAHSQDWRRLVEGLAHADPDALPSREARMAFWVNVYNVLAMDLVARNHPLESIRDIGSLWRPVWKHPAGRVDGRSVTLDQIEHEIVRPMGDPRTHAVVICASTSCPALPREPLRAATLDAQLDAAMRRWMADPGKGLRVDRDAGTVTLSRIFDWFPEDFEDAGGALAFATRYAPPEERTWLRARGDAVRVRHFEYDWLVNGL